MRSMAAPTAKTGLQGRFTASKMGSTKQNLEMSVPHKPQVFICKALAKVCFAKLLFIDAFAICIKL